MPLHARDLSSADPQLAAKKRCGSRRSALRARSQWPSQRLACYTRGRTKRHIAQRKAVYKCRAIDWITNKRWRSQLLPALAIVFVKLHLSQKLS